MVSDGTDLYLIRTMGIWKYFTGNDSSIQISHEYFVNDVIATYGDEHIYTIDKLSGNIYRTHISGHVKSEKISSGFWQNAHTVIYHNKHLYIFALESWKLNVETGLHEQYLKGEWIDTRAITKDGHVGYVVQSFIYEFNLERPEYQKVDSGNWGWNLPRALFTLNDKFYIWQSSYLYTVDRLSGEHKKVEVDFVGAFLPYFWGHETITAFLGKNTEYVVNYVTGLLGWFCAEDVATGVVANGHFYTLHNHGAIWKIGIDSSKTGEL